MSLVRRVASLLLPLGLVLSLAGCESGKEVAGIESAVATREADEHVVVRAALSCTVVYGMGRVDGGCDADDSNVCVRAAWYASSDESFQNPLFLARECGHVDAVRGTIFKVTSTVAIPRPDATKDGGPLRIVVRTEPHLDKRDETPEPVTIDSP